MSPSATSADRGAAASARPRARCDLATEHLRHRAPRAARRRPGRQRRWTPRARRCRGALQLASPSSSMSPSTATRRRRRRLRGEIVERGAHGQRVGVVAVVITTTPVASSTCSPRSAPNSTSTAPGRLHADRLGRGHRGQQVHELVTRGERHLELHARLTRDDRARSAGQSRQGRRRCRSRSCRSASRGSGVEHRDIGGDDRDGHVREQFGLRAGDSSRLPTSSRWTGPMFMITPTSGSAIRASSSICPKPACPSPARAPGCPPGAASAASGRPISVLKFAGLAATRRRARPGQR